jgi:CBS domain containing-hemolysin-like protein
VYEQFDSLPIQGDTFVYNGAEIKVSEMRQHRIIKLEAMIIKESAEGGEGL